MLLGSLAIRLALLWAVNALEADSFRALVVQDFDSIAIQHTDHRAGELTRKDRTGEQEREQEGPETAHGPDASRSVSPRRVNLYLGFSRMLIG